VGGAGSEETEGERVSDMTVTETMIEVRSHDDSWPPTNLIKFIEWISIYVEEIPAPYKDTATISITADDYTAEIRIAYERPQTPEEAAAQINRAKQRQSAIEDNERQLLQQLLHKYGAPP
jgi:hypothetical protein